MYEIAILEEKYFRVFQGAYNDFRLKARTDYKFEIDPLVYDDFIDSFKKGLISCVILLEDSIPTGFLAYTTLISESLELNIIHCIGSENLNHKRKLLLEKFLEVNKHLTREKVVTYPMLGKQAAFTSDIEEFGFKYVNTSVMVFNLSDISAINKCKNASVPELPRDYTITNWKTVYFKDAINVINQAFKDSSDALFDSRFTSTKGCKDILEKITGDVYGKFLPSITKVLLYKKHPVGFCFANLTNDKIANIPLVAILKKHRNYKFGKRLTKELVENIITSAITQGWNLKEINASCDSDNMASVNMYTSVGFSEKYSYPQAYLNKTNR